MTEHEQTGRVRFDSWPAGHRFRVTRAGASVVGLRPTGPASWAPVTIPLEIGTVLTCAGRGWTIGDGALIVKWRDARGQPICVDAEFKPSVGGLAMSVPDSSYVEPTDI